MFNKRGGGEVGVTTVGADRDSPRLGRGTRHGPRAVRCAKVFFHKDVAFLINDYVKTNQRKKKREGRTALAARIASPIDAGRAGQRRQLLTKCLMVTSSLRLCLHMFQIVFCYVCISSKCASLLPLTGEERAHLLLAECHRSLLCLDSRLVMNCG